MKKYAIISNKKRSELIQRVVQNGQSVSRVSKQLRMKLPSAKSIIRTFKKQGKVFDKKRIINRRIKSKKDNLSQTENHLSSNQQKIDLLKIEQKQEKIEKQIPQNEEEKSIIKENPPMENSKMIELMNQYYAEYYLNQQYAYYCNLVHYIQSQMVSTTQI